MEYFKYTVNIFLIKFIDNNTLEISKLTKFFRLRYTTDKNIVKTHPYYLKKIKYYLTNDTFKIKTFHIMYFY